MNIYTLKFSCDCPNNGISIDYALKIKTNFIIQVEEIKQKALIAKGYHENMADCLAELGGYQTLKAMHHGVTIKTVRGAK